MNVNVIIDLQFGSTGKGLLAGYLAEATNPDVVATAWAANAGHTYIDNDGNKFVHTMLANGIVSRNLKAVLIGPGSLINPVALQQEMDNCRAFLRGAQVMIHPAAAVILPEHVEAEQGPMTKIGSTKKGVGEAAIARIRRDPERQNVAAVALKGGPLESLVCTPLEYSRVLDSAKLIQVEGAQGYSLSMYHGFYPYCTSRDVSTHQTLADVGMPYGRRVSVYGTARTYPIRVANRYDSEGKMVGWSGPCYHDQEEISFEQLGVPTELTTVTKLPRRIFTFSATQIGEAARLCGVDHLFLNFCNYLPDARALESMVGLIHSAAPDVAVSHYGFGPRCSDVLFDPMGVAWQPGTTINAKIHNRYVRGAHVAP